MSGTNTKSTTKAAGNNTVVVGCKLPHGILLQLDKLIETKGTDGKTVETKAIRIGDKYTLNGANSSKVIGGYGITRNIPADFFEEWMKQNADFQPVKAGLIFRQDSLDKAEDQAEEQTAVKSGLEGIDPKHPDPEKKIVPADDK